MLCAVPAYLQTISEMCFANHPLCYWMHVEYVCAARLEPYEYVPEQYIFHTHL